MMVPTADGGAGRTAEGLMARVTSPVWVCHGHRLGLVLKSIKTKQPCQLPRDYLHVTMVGLEGLSTSGAYGLCLGSSPGPPFLDGGVVYLSVLCCVGFD